MKTNAAVPFFGSTSLARAFPYLGSGLVHCAVFASVGLAAAPAHLPPLAADRAVTLDVVEIPSTPAAARDEVPLPNRTASAAPEHGHQHPYPVPAAHDATPHDPKLEHLTASPEASSPSVAAAPVETGPMAPPEAHFVMRLSVPGSANANGVQRGSATGTVDAAVLPESAVSARATLLASAPAAYPPEARSNEAEADVTLEIVVDTMGAVREARPLSRAGMGFEEAALAAIRGYRFSPALKDGHPVRVRMRWAVQFRLH